MSKPDLVLVTRDYLETRLNTFRSSLNNQQNQILEVLKKILKAINAQTATMLDDDGDDECDEFECAGIIEVGAEKCGCERETIDANPPDQRYLEADELRTRLAAWEKWWKKHPYNLVGMNVEWGCYERWLKEAPHED